MNDEEYLFWLQYRRWYRPVIAYPPKEVAFLGDREMQALLRLHDIRVIVPEIQEKLQQDEWRGDGGRHVWWEVLDYFFPESDEERRANIERGLEMLGPFPDGAA